MSIKVFQVFLPWKERNTKKPPESHDCDGPNEL